ncbi:hypothetical protein [Paraburkholderia atlantica]|nr:hypothetical protein [Paraburkholderia atlantica]
MGDLDHHALSLYLVLYRYCHGFLEEQFVLQKNCRQEGKNDAKGF